MNLYITRLTLESELIDMRIFGQRREYPVKHLDTRRIEVDRKTAHMAVDKYFDEFEKMVKDD